MTERPILFSAPMVRAILAGTKTQTRRVVKPTPQMVTDRTIQPWDGDAAALLGLLTQTGMSCPYGQPGDRLWVRETFAVGIHQMADVNHWAYAADPFGVQQRLGERWKPSIHMPRAASRITLEIASVRVERLQEISEADALAEGVQAKHTADADWTAREAFKVLWESINGGGSWDANPWVWVVEFKRLIP